MTPTSFDDGLRFIFDPVSLSHLPIEHLDLAEADSASLQDALHASDSTYAAAARSLGLSERFPEQVLNGLGYDLLDYGKVALAITVFQRNVEAYPQSVNVYDSLGDGFLAAADSASALAQFRKAVEVAHRTGVPVIAETQQKLDRLEASERTSQN
jgi:tetratricopeptide (TPR) repeat protein